MKNIRRKKKKVKRKKALPSTDESSDSDSEDGTSRRCKRKKKPAKESHPQQSPKPAHPFGNFPGVQQARPTGTPQSSQYVDIGQLSAFMQYVQ